MSILLKRKIFGDVILIHEHQSRIKRSKLNS